MAMTDTSLPSQQFAEVSSSGAVRVVRAEGQPLTPQNLEPTLALVEAGMNDTEESIGQNAAYVFPNDIANADATCGGPRFISTCTFPGSNDAKICFPAANGGTECVHGLCVCGKAEGCLEPMCTQAACSVLGAVQCADGRSCIAQAGLGWQCWHPCNFAHHPAEYGRTNGAIAQIVRTQTAACHAAVVPPHHIVAGAHHPQAHHPQAHQKYRAGSQVNPQVEQPYYAPKDPPLDAGIDLTYQSSPIIGKQVAVNKESESGDAGWWKSDAGRVLAGRRVHAGLLMLMLACVN